MTTFSGQLTSKESVWVLIPRFRALLLTTTALTLYSTTVRFTSTFHQAFTQSF